MGGLEYRRTLSSSDQKASCKWAYWKDGSVTLINAYNQNREKSQCLTIHAVSRWCSKPNDYSYKLCFSIVRHPLGDEDINTLAHTSSKSTHIALCMEKRYYEKIKSYKRNTWLTEGSGNTLIHGDFKYPSAPGREAQSLHHTKPCGREGIKPTQAEGLILDITTMEKLNVATEQCIFYLIFGNNKLKACRLMNKSQRFQKERLALTLIRQVRYEKLRTAMHHEIFEPLRTSS